MSLSTYYLEYGSHLPRLHRRRRRRRRRRAYPPTSNTASHDNQEKINSWVSFSFLYGYGAPLGGSGLRSSAVKKAYVHQNDMQIKEHNSFTDIGKTCQQRNRTVIHFELTVVIFKLRNNICKLPFTRGY